LGNFLGIDPVMGGVIYRKPVLDNKGLRRLVPMAGPFGHVSGQAPVLLDNEEMDITFDLIKLRQDMRAYSAAVAMF
jgi:hypothetical protein